MHLVMFDIDGTLTETMKVDEECFVRSFNDVFGFADIDTDWSHYPCTTDSGIFHDVFTSRIGRSPTAQEVSRFRQHFIQLLTAALSQSPFAPVAGADRLLSLLAEGGSHRVSLATGVGVIPPASRWPVPGCALTTIRRHRRMTPSTGSPL
jgi:beta-phosphoglucomutase-like phosphatase (HAD superfamily)